MRHVRLVAVTDEYDNTPGLALKGANTAQEGFMADRDGLLTAHDIIEHQNGPQFIGRVWDELEALGGIWHTRGRWGDMMTSSMHSVEVNIASDLTRMFPEWGADGWPPHQHRLKATRPCDEDEGFLQIISMARKDIPREWNDDFDGEGAGGFADLERYLDEALHRMRTGFRKAERRFHNKSRFASNSQFRAIKEACERAVKWVDYEGQEFRLSYGGGEATVTEVELGEDY